MIAFALLMKPDWFTWPLWVATCVFIDAIMCADKDWWPR